MAPPKTTNATNVEEDADAVEVVNFQFQDEEGMDIDVDGGSVGAEAEAPAPIIKSRSLCNGKVLAGVLLGASIFVITVLAVDNSAKSEFIQAQSESAGMSMSKAAKSAGPSCAAMEGHTFRDCESGIISTVGTSFDCTAVMPEGACCYALELVWGGGYYLNFELSSYLHKGKFQFQGCGNGYSISGAYDMDDEVYSLTKTQLCDQTYVFYDEDMTYDNLSGGCPPGPTVRALVSENVSSP